MKITSLGFRQPGDKDSVNIQELSNNFDLVEKEILKRPEKTGDASEMTVSFSESGSLTKLTQGDTVGGLFGKLQTAVKELTAQTGLLGNKDISGIGDGTVTGGISSIDSRMGDQIVIAITGNSCRIERKTP